MREGKKNDEIIEKKTNSRNYMRLLSTPMSRMNGKNRKRLYGIISVRDGEFCAMCEIVGSNKSLCIDHIDNNNNNNDLDNLQLLCKSCNTKKNPRGKAKPENESAEVETPKQSEEIRLKKKYEPMFRKWIEGQIQRYGRILLQDAVESGAEITGASIQTVERYLRKMCSLSGKLKVTEVDGKKYAEFKEWWKTST